MPDFEPPPPIDDDEMPDFEPPPPIDDNEMPDFEPPPPIDDDEMPDYEPPLPIDDDEMPDFEPSTTRKRKEWDHTSINKTDQQELNNLRKNLAEDRRQINVLLGKLNKSGKNYVKTGKYRGLTYDDLLKQSDNFTKQINNIENQLLLTKQKIQRMEYRRVPFTDSDLQEKSKKLKKTPRKTKYKKKPAIEKSLFEKIEGMRRDTAPDSDREEDDWEGSGLAHNYKAIYYRDPEKLIEKLDIICGSISAGNTSYELKNQGKAVVIERFNKTLKNKMYKQFTVQGNTQYLDMLPKLIKEYNNTKHSSIKMSPTEASKKKNEGIVYFNLYGDMEQVSSKPKFKVGDKVRISKYKRIVFDKGYTPNWSEEIFKINKIQYTNPITYKLKDLRDEEIQGSFYEPELLKAKQDVFRIDKVIRRDYKKKQALVKWKGYSDDFNSWIPFKDLQQI
ncbi:hypothetical protein ACROYT_G042541 [Oculina patagonica]